MEHAARGKKAIENSQYEEAAEHYTAALKQSPESPDYYINRAIAYQRTQRFDEALHDAEHAVVYAQKRAKREQIIEAQFRRGCALYSLGRFGDAEFVFGLVKSMNKDHKAVQMWINKTSMALGKLPADDSQRQKAVSETPSLTTPSSSPSSNSETSRLTTTSASHSDDSAISESVPAVSPLPPQQTADKILRDWYQNTQAVYFILLVRGVQEESAQIEVKERSLSINFPLANGSTYDLTLEPLFAAVNVEKSIVRVLASKIEIILVKTNPGQRWSQLESNEPIPKSTNGSTAVVSPAANAAPPAEVKVSAPAYPTSSKSGPKDWDKVVKDIRRAEKKTEDGADNAGATGDDDDDDDVGGDPTNHFFKKLFKGASPETQRAMVKSYTESNGTALSTNWEEVSKGKVETAPPDGMQAKSWEA